MKERLYNVKYLQLSVFSEPKTINEEITQQELRELLDCRMITLLEVTPVFMNGSPKYRIVKNCGGKYNPEGKGYDII